MRRATCRSSCRASPWCCTPTWFVFRQRQGGDAVLRRVLRAPREYAGCGGYRGNREIRSSAVEYVPFASPACRAEHTCAATPRSPSLTAPKRPSHTQVSRLAALWRRASTRMRSGGARGGQEHVGRLDVAVERAQLDVEVAQRGQHLRRREAWSGRGGRAARTWRGKRASRSTNAASASLRGAPCRSMTSSAEPTSRTHRSQGGRAVSCGVFRAPRQYEGLRIR